MMINASNGVAFQKYSASLLTTFLADSRCTLKRSLSRCLTSYAVSNTFAEAFRETDLLNACGAAFIVDLFMIRSFVSIDEASMCILDVANGQKLVHGIGQNRHC